MYAGTPRDIVAKLQSEVVKALSDREVRKHYVPIGLDPVGNSLDEIAGLIRDDIARWGKVVRAAGVRVE